MTTPVEYPLKHIPRPNAKNIALRVTPVAERNLRHGHPWLFANSIRSQSRAGQPGDLAVIFDHQRNFLAVGLYDPASTIRVRVLQHRQPAAINAEWFQNRLQAAQQIRATFPPNTTGYRLLHGENDAFPGLALDNYAKTFVVKLYSAAWIPHLQDLLPLWINLNPERIIVRLSRELARQPEHLHGLEDGTRLSGPPPEGTLLFTENGLTFEVDPWRGHKTGFYLDQRENRARVEGLASGASLLNVFAYTGGFSVYAARGGATAITSIDQSQPALKAAKRNLTHNSLTTRHTPLVGDAFTHMTQLIAEKRRFDVVVIDPPSFAKSQAEIPAALKAYRRLTRLGIQLLQPEGLLVQASCSSRVNAEAFYSAVLQTAQNTGRPLREIERASHPIDHPITFPEGEYLKCLFALTS